MNEIVSVIPDPQATSVMQPPHSALDGPALFSQTAAMRRAALGQLGCDAAPFQLIAVRLRVVTPVAKELFGAAARSSCFALHAGHRSEQGPKLGDVVCVGAGHAHRQRHALSVHHQVMFGARASAVGGVWADGLAFFSWLEETPTARTEDESMAARDQSKAPAWCSLESKSACSASHTPTSCQALSRRQQLMPDPQPISWGKYSQGSPVLRTNNIPVKAARSSKRGLPPLGLAGSGGKSGEISNHNSSSNSGFAMPNSLQKSFC